MSTRYTTGAGSPEEHRTAHLLAARTGADMRTCLRALREGTESIRTMTIRTAIERELAAIQGEQGAPR